LSFPKLLLANVRSICNKADDFYGTCVSLEIDIAMATETWIHSNMNTSSLEWKDYLFFYQNRCDKKGGGVCAWCHKIYKPKHIVIEKGALPKSVDIISFIVECEVMIGFILIYIPPQENNNSDIDAQLSDYVDRFLNETNAKDIILCGDFNRSNLTILEGEHNLQNIVNVATRKNAILDKMFVTEDLIAIYSEVSTLDPVASSDHLKILACPTNNDSSYHKRNISYRTVYDFRKSNLDLAKDVLTHNISQSFYNVEDPNFALNQLYNSIYTCLSTIPKKTVTHSNNDKPWITDRIKSIINQRWSAYRNKNFVKYDHLKQKAKDMICKAKNNWLSNGLKKNGIWSTVKTLEGKNKCKVTFTINDLEAVTSAIKMFYNCPSFHYSITQSTCLVNVNNDDIYEQCAFFLSNIKTKKAIGSDAVPNTFYKLFADFLVQPLSHLCSQVLKTSIFPDSLKHGTIIPIPKSIKVDTNNFRPITILNTLSLLLEKVIIKHYHKDIYSNYGPNQFGFKPGSSTTIAIAYLLVKANNILSENHFKGCLITAIDLSKAFDNVPHINLLQKLTLSMPTSFVALINSYLKNRTAMVKIESNKSPNFIVNKGVPQGSCLGPSLFCLYISDLQPSGDSIYIKYADDLTILTPITQNIENEHEKEIDHIRRWCNVNKMIINEKKTQVLAITKKGFSFNSTIQTQNAVKFLGVLIDEKLNFNSHYTSSIKNAARNLYLLKKLNPYCSQKELNNIFLSKIASITEYNFHILPSISASATNSIDRLYKRAYKIIYKDKQTLSRSSKLIQQVRISSFFKQIISDPNHILFPYLPHRSRTGRFILPEIKSTRVLHSFFIQGAILFNESLRN